MKRWPIIRHMRYCWYVRQLNCWWEGFGQHFWLEPNRCDIQFLMDVWDGKA